MGVGRGSLFETAAAAAAVLRTRGLEVVLSGPRRQFLSHQFTSQLTLVKAESSSSFREGTGGCLSRME